MFLAGVAHLVILSESDISAMSNNFIKGIREICAKMKRHVGTLWPTLTQQGRSS